MAGVRVGEVEMVLVKRSGVQPHGQETHNYLHTGSLNGILVCTYRSIIGQKSKEKKRKDSKRKEKTGIEKKVKSMKQKKRRKGAVEQVLTLLVSQCFECTLYVNEKLNKKFQNILLDSVMYTDSV